MFQPQSPRISVVIAAHNEAEILPTLLDKTYGSSFKNFEVVLVDDASTDDTGEVVKRFPLRYLRNPVNRGAAFSRNQAAQAARGEILLSFDSDVLPLSDIVAEVDLFFRENPEAVAVTGFPGTGWENPTFFARYKYLRDYSYWHQEHDPDSFYYFRPAVGAVKREAFLKLGGYDEGYAGASVEDLEFSYRLARLGKIYFNPKMKVAHPFGGIRKLVKTYFYRTFKFLEILKSKRQFSGVATTAGEAQTIAYASLCLTLLLGGWFIRPLWLLWLPTFAWFIILQRKFLGLAYRREGTLFAILAFLTSWFLYLVIVAGAFWAGVVFVLAGVKKRLA